jgi:hypothetical protein
VARERPHIRLRGRRSARPPLHTKHRFKPLLKRAGLPQIRFHDLRHAYATLLLSKNVNPKVVSEMLGHATIAIALDTYSHVLPMCKTAPPTQWRMRCPEPALRRQNSDRGERADPCAILHMASENAASRKLVNNGGCEH